MANDTEQLTASKIQAKDSELIRAKVLIADEISAEGIKILEEAIDVIYDPKISPEDLVKNISSYDALLVRSRTRVTKEVIQAGSKLKVIGRAGVGVDNIDVDAATEKGILVINSPEGNTASAAEHTLAIMLSLARMVPAADSSFKKGLWERSKFTGCELFNKTLGVVGLGKVGNRVATAALAMGMKVIVYDPLVSAEKVEKLGYKLVTLDEVWQNADFITLHTPKTRETTNLVNDETIAKMKKGVRIINAARGGIINEESLAKAIVNGHVGGAALDVFDQEPPQDSALVKLGQSSFADKLVLTPHLGASTFEAQFNVAIDLAEQIRDYLISGLARSPVNLPFMRQDVLKSLGKFLWLAETMGAIAGQLAEGSLTEVQIVSTGNIAEKDTAPLVVAALRGLFSQRVAGVTYVNAHLIARNHGIKVRESKMESPDETSGNQIDEVSVILTTTTGTATLSGTILAHAEPVITKINSYPINLTPARYMLFTSHNDKPGMVAKVAGILGEHNINISTMAVARSGAREKAVMVMTLDDPIQANLTDKLANIDGIDMARFVALSNRPI